jgi:hypothetical protein
MNIYPTLSCGISLPFKPKMKSGLVTDEASNGEPKTRSFFTQDRGSVDLLHKMATAGDKTTLDAFYAANKLLAFTLAVGGDTYTCKFADAPQPALARGNRWDFTVPLLLL